MNNELIKLEQLPIIKYQLEQLSIEIKEKVEKANSLIVNEDTVKEVKQVRANLNKEFSELETQRKTIKQMIMSKYDEFEEVYKENVSNLYKDADSSLKEKIDNVENQLKEEKKEELKAFAIEHIVANNLENIVEFENIDLNITLSASMSSLKDKIVEFIEKVSNDVKLIKLEELSDEILLEYKKDFDLTNAKLTVIERYKQLEEIQKQNELVEKIVENEKQNEELINEIIEEQPKNEQIEEVITVSFTITDTKENIIKVREFMKKEGIQYE